MKNLNSFIMEKLKINKNTKMIKSQIVQFAKLFEIDLKDAQWIYDNYIDANGSKTLRDEIYDKGELDLITPFEMLFGLAGMLIDDGNDAECYSILGYKKYKENFGDWNPYDYPYFDNEDSNGITLLEYIQKWISKNFDEFNDIYEFLKKIKKENSKATILNVEYILNFEWIDEIN